MCSSIQLYLLNVLILKVIILVDDNLQKFDLFSLKNTWTYLGTCSNLTTRLSWIFPTVYHMILIMAWWLAGSKLPLDTKFWIPCTQNFENAKYFWVKISKFSPKKVFSILFWPFFIISLHCLPIFWFFPYPLSFSPFFLPFFVTPIVFSGKLGGWACPPKHPVLGMHLNKANCQEFKLNVKTFVKDLLALYVSY